MKKANGIRDAPLISPKKKSPTKKSGISFLTPVATDWVILAQPMTTSTHPTCGKEGGLNASAIKDSVVAIKLAEASLLPIEHGNEVVEAREVTISSMKGEVKQAWREALTYQKKVNELKGEKEREKENFDLAKEELEKKVAEMVGKEKE
ncbi:hypothetical protein Acr_27g0000230 [Actinidia rufa]|uniref:Uncharacterized protein n=1 Tax=Actinidia rufa TaxID=165716 RepID=A0A7J0H6A3_9ERIC|nr:hypothetical protein Acr_27g0000230 [Actinidia rufa]